MPATVPDRVGAFIARWSNQSGGAERANYQMFLRELCDVIDVLPPKPANKDDEFQDYRFERPVQRRDSEDFNSTLRIDLYKRGAFILEAKQSRATGGRKAIAGQSSLPGTEPAALGRRHIQKGWDVLMLNARRQAEDYVFRLEASEPVPAFLVVCDVGHCFELYADFSGTGRAYTHFPDRNGFRIYLEELRDPATRERLRCVWDDPDSLNPAKKKALVTRGIADRLAQVSKALEKHHPAEDVAHFLMRCIFTMFAEDVDLLPRGEFTKLIADCRDNPASFAPLLEELWARMDEADGTKRFYSAFKQRLRYFNGNLFRNARAFPLAREEIGELLAAAEADWTMVEPAIFGTLLENALDPKDRDKLGAHYTPRVYVDRLVQITVMQPLRAAWRDTEIRIQTAIEDGKPKDAIALARAFHHSLCETIILDPACGTGNFLYVALELMKTLEGEVLEKLAELGAEKLALEGETVDPHQFLGLELNPRAAAIAELVVWIGYLQQHYRSRTEHPSEPILRAFKNINFGERHGYDAVLTWDGYPLPQHVTKNGKAHETCPGARLPIWPEADFIVGNPPFIGGKDLRAELGALYAETLWAVHKDMNDSADFVMYWWDRAAELLTRKGTRLKRFGFITTNSITQVFQRRTVARYLDGKHPLSLVFAIADHPWTKATDKAAAVRIAMTVAEAGQHDGTLLHVMSETGLDTDTPLIEFRSETGRINADLTVGVDVTAGAHLLANEGLASRGVQLIGNGFIVSPSEAAHLGLGNRPGLEAHIRDYRNGRDLTGHPRNVMVIDLFGLPLEDVRRRFPEVYQHLYETVRMGREAQYKKSPTNDARTYLQQWWVFGKARGDLRDALTGLPRYIATVETAKHRIFQFLDASILPDNMIVVIASNTAEHLTTLSSRVHRVWARNNSASLGVYIGDVRYTKSRCFDPFPFPDCSGTQREALHALGEELDSTRKIVLAEYPDLTLTGLYNVLEKIRCHEPLNAEDEDVKQRGRVLILRDLHDAIDRATSDAYGWPHDLPEAEILARLVALNAARRHEEEQGRVRWLRPDFQAPRFGQNLPVAELDLQLADVIPLDRSLPAFPKDRYEQPLAVKRVLAASGRAMDAAAIARAFKGPHKARLQIVEKILLTLARYGDVTALGDGRYAARLAA